jgi:hypothetical protein
MSKFIAAFSFSPCGRRWIDRAAVETDEGCLRNPSVVGAHTPHPALRATFSHKGRRKEFF